MKASTPDLIIVYNADGGVFSRLSDAVHKVVSPRTYECRLCKVTYGALAMEREWRAFLDALPNPKRFYHRDEFARAYPGAGVALPAILVGQAHPEVLVSAEDMARIDDLQALIALVERRLTGH